MIVGMWPRKRKNRN